ncbi:MAG: DUF2064 domain-containing protein [Actinomycetota bacterium]|nr:DUF2064 domain-containing protein [Actinomycetota bacterium]
MSELSAAQLLVIAKEPVAGRVKTRLCPPCTPEQAAQLASAALEDTLAAVRATPAARRVIALDGDPTQLDLTGFDVLPQRGTGLGARLAHAIIDAMAGPHRARPTLLVGMDTPQLDPVLLADALELLVATGAVLGMAADGGWWALGVSEPEGGAVLADVPMSQADTGALTGAALARKGIRWAALAELRDVDTIEDARAVAALAPTSRFAAALTGFGLDREVSVR